MRDKKWILVLIWLAYILKACVRNKSEDQKFVSKPNRMNFASVFLI